MEREVHSLIFLTSLGPILALKNDNSVEAAAFERGKEGKEAALSRFYFYPLINMGN